ncbi:MAG: AraC family transcriptional regulator [Actinomycetota bacterium]
MATGIEHVLPVLGRMRKAEHTLDLSEVARAVALSPTHAQRVVRTLTGESPDRYQRRLRLERGAALLLSTDDTVLDIAVAVGFDSHEVFTRAFHRHYGVSPTGYRRRTPGRLNVDQARLIDDIGPCIGVLPAAVRPTSTPSAPRPGGTSNHSEHTMSYSIERSELTETPVLFIRSRADKSAVAEVLGQSLPTVYGHVMEAGLAMAGPPYVRYLDQSPAFVTLEAGIPLVDTPPAPPADGDIIAGALPGGTAATTVHTGPYETIGAGHEAIDRWMAAEGESSGGAPWEIYVTDPADVPDPEDWQTRIVWPLA